MPRKSRRSASFACTFLIAVAGHVSVPAADAPISTSDKPLPTWSLEFSPDGKYLAAATGISRAFGGVVVWNTNDWTPHLVHPEETGAADVSFSRDGATLAYCTCGTWVGLLDVAGAKLLKRFEASPPRLFAVEMSADGKTLLTGAHDEAIKFWNVETGELEKTFDGHSDTVYDLQVSPDGVSLLSCGGEFSVRLWDLHSETSRTSIDPGRRAVRLAFSADGRFYAVARTDSRCSIMDTASGAVRADILGGDRSAEFSRDARYFITSGRQTEAFVYRIDLEKADAETQGRIDDLIRQFEDDSAEVREAASAQLIAIGLPAEASLAEARNSPLAETRLRARRTREDVLSPKPIAQLPGHVGPVEVICVSPDDTMVVTADRLGTIRIWRTGDWTHLRDLNNPLYVPEP